MQTLKTLISVKLKDLKFSKNLQYHFDEVVLSDGDHTHMTLKDIKGEIGYFKKVLADKEEYSMMGPVERSETESMLSELKTKLALLKDNNVSIIIL